MLFIATNHSVQKNMLQFGLFQKILISLSNELIQWHVTVIFTVEFYRELGSVWEISSFLFSFTSAAGVPKFGASLLLLAVLWKSWQMVLLAFDMQQISSLYCGYCQNSLLIKVLCAWDWRSREKKSKRSWTGVSLTVFKILMEATRNKVSLSYCIDMIICTVC